MALNVALLNNFHFTIPLNRHFWEGKHNPVIINQTVVCGFCTSG